MRKFIIIFIIIISLMLAILFNPRSAESTIVTLRIDAQDIKEVIYLMIHKTVSINLQREINGMTRLNFLNFNRSEALLLMDMLTSNKCLIVNVDPDNGNVSDFGFY